MMRTTLASRPRRARAGAIDWNRSLGIVAIAAFVVAIVRAVGYYFAIPHPDQSIGIDYQLYLGAAHQWQTTGDLYQPFQLAGPYHVIGNGEILYPPIVLILLVPFLVLPGILWWILPLGLTTWALARLRPASWSLALIGALSVTHAVQAPFFWGTPVIWLVPAVAWGFLLGWPAAAVLVKPTLAPFVLTGLTRPTALLIGCIGFAVLGLPFGSLWLDWLTAIRNSDLDVTYSYTQNLLLVLPVIAWLGRDGRVPELPKRLALHLGFSARP